MEFSIEFYETNTGKCPVLEFLDDMKASDPDDFAAILAGLAKLKNRNYHRPPLSKSIGDDLFELRHVGKLNTRVLYFFSKVGGLSPFTAFEPSPKKSSNKIVRSPRSEGGIG